MITPDDKFVIDVITGCCTVTGIIDHSQKTILENRFGFTESAFEQQSKFQFKLTSDGLKRCSDLLNEYGIKQYTGLLKNATFVPKEKK